MDVYVVSNLWAGEGAVVIGAGADLSSAETIADRAELPVGVRWDEWVTTGAKRHRVSRMIQNGMECRFDQEIVCVPLAGVPTVDDWLDRADAFIGFTPKSGEAATYPWASPDHDILADVIRVRNPPPAEPSMKAMVDAMRLVAEARAANRELGNYPLLVRVGAGSAKEYFERAAVRLLGTEAPSIFDDRRAQIQGLPVAVDPALPPDMIRIGDVAYLIDHPAPGQMLRFGAEVLRALDITSPPSTGRSPT